MFDVVQFTEIVIILEYDGVINDIICFVDDIESGFPFIETVLSDSISFNPDGNSIIL